MYTNDEGDSMNYRASLIPVGRIDQLILLARGHRVMLDCDLAVLYGVETRVLNQAVRRNLDRFPDDFMFPLSREEVRNISQIVTCSTLKQLMTPPEKPRKEIGFHVKEDAVPYRIKRKAACV